MLCYVVLCGRLVCARYEEPQRERGGLLISVLHFTVGVC
jgi:hypothetical protein